MAEEFEESGLLGPKEWVTIAAIVIAVYLYRAFNHLLPSSIGSPANASAAAQATLDDEARRRNIQEARRKLIEESERKIDDNREKLKQSNDLQEKEEQKRREQLERAEKLLDITKKQSTSGASTSFRKEYNPLMGDGGSCSWRPTKKGPARGG